MPTSNILHASTDPDLLTRLREIPGGPACTGSVWGKIV